MGYFFYNLEGIGEVLLIKNCFDKEVTSTKDFDGFRMRGSGHTELERIGFALASDGEGI